MRSAGAGLLLNENRDPRPVKPGGGGEGGCGTSDVLVGEAGGGGQGQGCLSSSLSQWRGWGRCSAAAVSVETTPRAAWEGGWWLNGCVACSRALSAE